jgi:hypothetical protein
MVFTDLPCVISRIIFTSELKNKIIYNMGNNKVRGRIKLGSISIKGRLLLPETMKNMPRYNTKIVETGIGRFFHFS